MINKKSIVSSANDYDKDYLINICGGGDSLEKGVIDERFYRSVAIAKIKKGESVLDVGSGRGETAFLCANLGAKVTAVDNSVESVNLINKLSKKNLANNCRINTQKMNVKDLKFEKDSFDKVFFLETLEHLEPKDAELAMKELLRVLRPNGKLIISTGPNKILIDFLLFFAKNIVGIKDWKSRKYHINEQSYFSLEKFLKKFKIKYKILLHEDTNWFYGQTIKNTNLNIGLKKLVKAFNLFYDFQLFRYLRSFHPIQKYFCTGFLVEVTKL